MLSWFHEFSASEILLGPLSYTQLLPTQTEVTSGIHKVREGDLAQELHGWNNSSVLLKGVICTRKCVTEEYTERSLQGSVINFSLLGNGEPAKAFTKRKMDTNLAINPIFTEFFTFIFNKPQCCGQDCISLTLFHWNLMKQISRVVLI